MRAMTTAPSTCSTTMETGRPTCPSSLSSSAQSSSAAREFSSEEGKLADDKEGAEDEAEEEPVLDWTCKKCKGSYTVLYHGMRSLTSSISLHYHSYGARAVHVGGKYCIR